MTHPINTAKSVGADPASLAAPTLYLRCASALATYPSSITTTPASAADRHDRCRVAAILAEQLGEII